MSPQLPLQWTEPEFSAKSRGAARKINISRQYRIKVTFQSSIYSESKTAKSSLRGPDIESCIIRKPRDSLEPLAFPLASANILLCRSDRRLFRICTLARSPRQWTLQIFIFWAGSPMGPLNLVKSDNESDRTPGFDFGVKRPRRRVLGP